MKCFEEELQAWLDINAPRLPELTYEESKLYCCEYNLYLERERLHHLAREMF